MPSGSSLHQLRGSCNHLHGISLTLAVSTSWRSERMTAAASARPLFDKAS
jgi:hypothetical protein